MDIWNGLTEVPSTLESAVVTIGVFDGIHRGHRMLISQATQRAQELAVPSVLLTFNPHPLAILCPDRMPPMLGSVAERADLVAELGIDHMLALNFNADMARLEPEQFFVQVLLETLHARTIVVGENFSFGYRAQGTTDTLKELGKKYGVEVNVVQLLTENNTVLCSTFIRNCLASGDIAQANWALGRNYSVSGQVVRGAGRGGKELGYPTANLYFPDSVALPQDGVYAGFFQIISEAPIDGDMEKKTRYPAAISVGHNPTFGDERRSVESFVLDKDTDLYGHTVVVEFVEHIRGMKKFDSLSDLLDAIATDVDKVRDMLAV
ncbi:bifunctional riboflavin kinase/FAD synthetase [Corynebacterium sp. sy017]|uniref:bifunctional riboflavin kinase/FAD synthetase n=1 Tax=unclassified Corynebacterium TaxID=2624378 RepID=UPI001184EC50|nr:bifunctional riboflavin kinase/FAD synthetase [Corynebacterium sp. SY003]MBP3087820.1 bifunctional riboflavin kinase/FAD synthetase [Corynebacterium sp. sy017]TSD92365.1 bifunctional riboflavin kinase/FAD synthetase [Corynebacterium sp. SY003]